MATPSEGLNPLLPDLEVMKPPGRKPATKLNSALIQEPAKSLDGCLLGSAEVGLSTQQPIDFPLLDHP